MSDHEFWNELGNLYFMSGAYEPAIHAYARAIAANRKFGRPYSNMALAFTQTGKYIEAIELYHRGLELLEDQKDKALTWNHLGILYRQLKDYQSATVAYRKADDIDPSQYEGREEANLSSGQPLMISTPPIDLQAILRGDESEEDQLVEEVNAEFELVEDRDADADNYILQWFEGDFVPPDPEVNSVLDGIVTPEDESLIDVQVMEHGEWKPAPFEDITPVLDRPAMTNDSFVKVVDEIEDKRPVETPIPALMNMTEAEAVQYSQVEYPLTDPVHFDMLEADIEKFKNATVNNPRNAIAWEGLGDIYKQAGRYKDAIRAYERAINITPNKPSYYYRLGLVYAAERLESEAINAFQKTLELDNTYTLAHASLGSQYRKIGLDDLAKKHIDIALNTAFEDENEYNRACLEAICGNTDRAFELLQVALHSKQTHVSWVMKDPDLDPLRKDPRFETLLSAYAVSR